MFLPRLANVQVSRKKLIKFSSRSLINFFSLDIEIWKEEEKKKTEFRIFLESNLE